jgi:transcriptional regulator with XRE-family HTH domain
VTAETSAQPMPVREMRGLEQWLCACDARFDEVVRELGEVPSRYAHGYWTIAYEIAPVRKQPPLADLLEFLKGSRGHETGWPAFWVPERTDIAPKPRDGLIECRLARRHVWSEPAHSDFWRVSPEGFAYLARGYQEDGLTTEAPGSVFDMALPVWRIGECLLQASRLASCFGDDEAIRFTARWRGLRNRRLVVIGSRDRYAGPLVERAAAQDEIRSTVVTTTRQIPISLPELVMELTSTLYATFDFFAPSLAFYRNETQVMRKGRF